MTTTRAPYIGFCLTLLTIFGMSWSALGQDKAPWEPKDIPIINRVCKGNGAALMHKRSTAAVNYPRGYYNYYVNHYNLWIEPDFTTSSITGRTDIHFRPTGPLDTLVFDLSSALRIDSIKFHGQVLPFSRTADQLVLMPLGSAPLPQDTISIWYGGVPNGTGLGTVSFASHSTGIVFATLSEPYGARDWWATRQDYNQKIDSIDVFITTRRAGYKGISNGVLQDTSTVGNARIWHWKHKYPIVNYLVAVAVSNYQVRKDTVNLQGGLMNLEDYFFPQNRLSWFRDAPVVKAQLRNFERIWTPYPFQREKYGHTQFTFGGGQEHQTNSFMADLGFDLMAHELAHQWFGDLVTCKGMREIWLNEGFASYNEYLTDEGLNPSGLASWRQQAVAAAIGAPNGRIYKFDTANVWGIFDYATTYQKPGILLHQLRKTIGDTAFFKGIRNYLNDPIVRFNLARTGDLERNISAAAGQSMAAFFDAWIYQPGFPNYTLTNVVLAGDTLKFTINQSPSSAAATAFFPGAVPFTFGNGLSTDTTVYINHLVQGQQVKIRSRFVPTTVRVNATNEAITSSRRFNVTPVTSISQYSLVAANLSVWPNPTVDRVYIAIPGQTEFVGKVQVRDLSGRTILQRDLIGGQALDLVNLASGMYQVRLVTSSGTWQTTLSKQ